MKQRIGPIMQVAYVVEDLDQAIRQWVDRMRVGPFVVQRDVQYASATYRGEPTAPIVSVAFAFSGDLHIELLQQLNDAPSIFRTHVEEHGYGQQHVGILTDDIQGDTARLAEHGITVLQHMISEQGIDTRLFDTEFLPGTAIELIGVDQNVTAGLAYMRQLADEWDGVTAIAG